MTTTPANPAMEPCPFCGGNAFQLYDEDSNAYAQIECHNCGAEGPMIGIGGKRVADQTREDYITAWNSGALRERFANLKSKLTAVGEERAAEWKRAEAAEARVAELEKGIVTLDSIDQSALDAAYLRGRDDGVRIGFERAREDYYEEKYTSADQVIAELRGES